MARLELLKAFPLPSLSKQTTKEFLWVIRTDPDLDGSVLGPLIEAASDAAANSGLNVMVFGSNDLCREAPFARFRNSTAFDAPVLFGDADLLESYHSAARTRLLVETRLDSDDCLSLDYMEMIQREAKEWADGILRDAGRTGDKRYRMWCMKDNVSSPYQAPDVFLFRHARM